MSILPLVALKPVILLTLRSAPRPAIRLARLACNLLADAALARGQAVTSTYLTAIGFPSQDLWAEERRRRETNH